MVNTQREQGQTKTRSPRSDVVFNLQEVREPSNASRRVATREVNRNRVADLVAREMAQTLLEAHLPEGTRLPPESELCSTMGCSRTALRSALRRLESWGLITIQTGRNGGPIIRYPRVSDLLETMSIFINAEHATLSDVLVARRAIDPIIASAAATNATDEDIARIDQVLTRLRTTSLTQRSFLAAMADYHAAIAEASHLVILGFFLRVLTSFGEASLWQYIPPDGEYEKQIVSLLGRIRDAVASHDADGARAEALIMRRESERHWQERGPTFLSTPIGLFEFN